jgi:hypothetical protein
MNVILLAIVLKRIVHTLGCLGRSLSIGDYSCMEAKDAECYHASLE